MVHDGVSIANMDIADLQTALAASGRYHDDVDGRYGPQTGAAVMLAMTDGPDTRLGPADIASSAQRLGLTPAHISAVTAVESSGGGFAEGRPVLLFEPHRFSRATAHLFDGRAPDVSYPAWNPSGYPRTQAGRYAQLVKAVGLNVDAGFASASYGLFQILGENFAACGYRSAFDFAAAQAFDEVTQLQAFEAFLRSRGLLGFLQARDWAGFAQRYNGTAYQLNHYDTRLAAAYQKAGGF